MVWPQLLARKFALETIILSWSFARSKIKAEVIRAVIISRNQPLLSLLHYYPELFLSEVFKGRTQTSRKLKRNLIFVIFSCIRYFQPAPEIAGIEIEVDPDDIVLINFNKLTDAFPYIIQIASISTFDQVQRLDSCGYSIASNQVGSI